jgi:hypothetical protein
MWPSIRHAFMISSQDYAGSKPKSYKIIIIQIFTILGKAKPNTEYVRSFNLEAVKHRTVEVSELPL